ncbi:MAG: DUF799 family lipoprotein [Magnetococcales bacterium]|nr:DUF799 family lipoprotein [Magnetococcales bacterium]
MKKSIFFRKPQIWLLGGLVVTALLTGCVAATKTAVVGGPAFTTNIGETESSVDRAGLPATVAFLPFVNGTDADRAFEIVRRTMSSHFSGKNYRMMHIREVDRRLRAAKLTDPAEIAKRPAHEIAGILGVDGLMYGTITHYDKLFLLTYAQVAVGVEMRLVNLKGKEIWNGNQVSRKHEGGVATTPVGLILNAAFAAWHIKDDANLFRAADELGRELMGTIPEPKAIAGAKRPRIMQVVHDGMGKILKFGDSLSIAVEAEPGLKAAYARVDGLGLVDLVETEKGFYTAKVDIKPKDNVKAAAVVAVVENEEGTMVERVSPLGVVNVDNIPPEPVTELKVEGRDDGLVVSWTSSKSEDLKEYKIGISDVPQGPFAELAKIGESRYTHKSPNFKVVHVEVIPVDQAGNVGQAVTVAGRAVPDPRFDTAALLPRIVPARITATSVMTRENSPYTINAPVELANTGVLLIEPGVAIHLERKTGITVQGELQIFGTQTTPVTVAGVNNGSYTTFLRLDSTLPVSIRGLRSSGGDLPIVITAGAPMILDSQLLNNTYSALEIGGSSRPVIRGCEIRGSNAAGVVVKEQAQPQFTGNNFAENSPFHIQSSSPYKLNARDNSWTPKATNITVLGNVDFKQSK